MSDARVEQTTPQVFVKFGRVLAGAQAFKFNGNINAVFRGQVALNDGTTVQAFIKDISRREFANELLASALALRLGLPVPTPIVARVSSSDLPAVNIPYLDSGDRLVFASASVPAPPILQVLQSSGAQAGEVMGRIAKWPRLGDLYGFDSWIANTDRHRGNLLFGGQDDVWLIDHGHSFTGPHWKPEDLVPWQTYNNRLSEWLTPFLAGSRRAQVAGGAEVLASDASQIDLAQLAAANGVRTMLGEDFNAIVSFLTARTEHIRKLSTTALGLLI